MTLECILASSRRTEISSLLTIFLEHFILDELSILHLVKYPVSNSVLKLKES